MSKVDVKVVLLGKHNVGKTCLVERYLHGAFRANTLTTVGAAFGARKVRVPRDSAPDAPAGGGAHAADAGLPPANAEEVTLGIWDTAGQERYESMSRIYYRGARAALVCHDLSDDGTSFDRAQHWVEELVENEPDCAVYIVGTKKDLLLPENGSGGGSVDPQLRPRARPRAEVEAFGHEVGGVIFETSAKTGENVEELFAHIARSALRRRDAGPLADGVLPTLDEQQPRGRCCRS